MSNEDKTFIFYQHPGEAFKINLLYNKDKAKLQILKTLIEARKPLTTDEIKEKFLTPLLKEATVAIDFIISLLMEDGFLESQWRHEETRAIKEYYPKL